MIAYLQLPASQSISDFLPLFHRLSGVLSWEIDSPRSIYFLLDHWMTKQPIRHLYQALRGQCGARIRFGAGPQKTTARAAALYRSVPHCTIVTRESVDTFLSQLPINLLPGLGRRTAVYLEQHGVRDFTAFRNLSATTLKQWFGVSGLILQQFARGLDPRVVEARRVWARY